MNIRAFFGGHATKMPDDVKHAFLHILYYTLLEIRMVKCADLVFTLSDHVHNIPGLIDKYSPDLFRYYWEIERPCFIENMQRIGEPIRYVQEHWEILEKHYKSIKPQTQA